MSSTFPGDISPSKEPLLPIELFINAPKLIKGAAEFFVFSLLWISATKTLRPLGKEEADILVEAAPKKLRAIISYVVG